MSALLGFLIDSFKSLELEKRLSPRRNPDIAWFYVFLPAFFIYIGLLSNYLNARPAIGSIDVYNASFARLVSRNDYMEVIVNNSLWAEGPLWVEDDSSSSGYLLFSDTKLNNIYKWEEGKGLFTIGKTRFQAKSGCKLNASHCDSLFEPGSNGIIVPLPSHYPAYTPTSTDFIVCQMGERSITLFRENGTRSILVNQFKGRKFNSPNDMILSPEGNLYFTDPPYGLYNRSKQINDRQLPFSGIYMIRGEVLRESIRTGVPVDGEKDIRLLHKDMRRPNGLAFSPDFSKLYVSNSESSDAYWKVFDVTDSGGLANGRVFYNASSNPTCTTGVHTVSELCQSSIASRSAGAPDGLKVDIFGNIFASGPGGVLVFSPEGDLLGMLRIDRPVSNVAFAPNGILFITAETLVIRLRTLTKPTRILSKR